MDKAKQIVFESVGEFLAAACGVRFSEEELAQITAA